MRISKCSRLQWSDICVPIHLWTTKLVTGLSGAVGAESTCVLLLEEMDTLDFWQRLIQFSGAQGLSADAVMQGLSFENRKTLKNNIWAIRTPTSEIASREFANTLLTWTWPAHRSPKIRSIASKALMRSHGFYRKLLHSRETMRADSFTLTEALEEYIKGSFRIGNESLAKLMSKDLRRCGYL